MDEWVFNLQKELAAERARRIKAEEVLTKIADEVREEISSCAGCDGTGYDPMLFDDDMDEDHECAECSPLRQALITADMFLEEYRAQYPRVEKESEHE